MSEEDRTNFLPCTPGQIHDLLRMSLEILETEVMKHSPEERERLGEGQLRSIASDFKQFGPKASIGVQGDAQQFS